MLNREEYNATFKHDLSQEEFEKLKPIILGSDNIKTIESLSFVDPETHELTEFVQVVRSGRMKRLSTKPLPLRT